jgi:hypothetical protein
VVWAESGGVREETVWKASLISTTLCQLRRQTTMYERKPEGDREAWSVVSVLVSAPGRGVGAEIVISRDPWPRFPSLGGSR